MNNNENDENNKKGEDFILGNVKIGEHLEKNAKQNKWIFRIVIASLIISLISLFLDIGKIIEWF